MTVKELHTFTDAELDTIADALKIADAHYRMLAETQGPSERPIRATFSRREFREAFEAQAREVSALQLKIEAGR